MEQQNSHCVKCGTPREDLNEIPWATRRDGIWTIICKPCRATEIEEQIEAFQKNPVDTEYTSNVICPYCGEEHEPDGEDSSFYTEDLHQFDCYNCSNSFNLETSISISYTTSKMED